jgi:acyl-CoA reductase-like NAD-dependent aldehyde dehydrogenase
VLLVGLGRAVIRADGCADPATVLTDVPDEAEISQTETLGPAVVLDTVQNAEEAVRRANSLVDGSSIT